MLFKLATAVGLMASLALASPVPEPDLVMELETRGSAEGVHLTNCDGVAYSHGAGDTRYSVIAYYANDAAAQSTSNNPTDISNAVSSQGWVQWEGRSVTGSFGTGVKFTSTINSNAASQSTSTKVGSGNNGSYWNCYKDNGRVLYYSDNGKGACKSIYYCLKP